MKINQSPSTQTEPIPANPATGQSAGKGSLDLPDVSFLNMMMNLGSLRSHSSDGSLKGHVEMTEMTAEPTGEEPGVEQESRGVHSDKKAGAKSEVTRLYDELSRIRVKNELEMLQGELKAGDLQFLEKVLIAGLPYQGGIPFQQVMTLNSEGLPAFGKLDASETLSSLLEKAYKSGRSLRVDLDGKSAVVLKFHAGKVSAEFLTKDPAMALYLKEYMDTLRNRLEEKELPVAQLTYRNDDEKPSRQNKSDTSGEKYE